MSDKTDLWDHFLEVYPANSINDMKLESYTDLKKDKAFIYWLEIRTAILGGIGGGSAFKFGIFRRRSSEEKTDTRGLCYTDDYAWYQKYGATEQEAWSTVHSLLVNIVEAAQAGDLEAIDNIKFSESVKWKIAFLYQDRDHPVIINIFKYEALQYLCEQIGIKGKLSYPEAYAALFGHYQKQASEDLLSLADQLWQEWEQREEQSVTKDQQAVGHWIVPLHAMLLDYGDVAQYDYVSPDNYPEGFSKFLEDAKFTKGDMRTKRYSITDEGRQNVEKKIYEFVEAEIYVLDSISGR